MKCRRKADGARALTLKARMRLDEREIRRWHWLGHWLDFLARFAPILNVHWYGP